MGMFEMRGQDLLELHQLLHLYVQAYPEEYTDGVKELLEGVSAHYWISTRGKAIHCGRNPRGAGRKKKYQAEHDEKVRNLYRQGMSLRRIAQEAGCSVGHVQDILKSQ